MKRTLTAPYLNVGHLILIGGDEDRRGEMTVLRRVVAVGDAHSVAVIPTASDHPGERGEAYRRVFSDLGVAEVSVVDVRSREDAARGEWLDMVRRADVVFFTGGDQVQLVETLEGTRVLEEVWRRFQSGATVAGTSAGAAAAGDPMIYDGDGKGLVKGSVRHARGFGFLEGITVDSHFMARLRVARLAQFLSSGLGRRGLGLAEDTAAVIDPSGVCEVVGRHVVTILEAGAAHETNYHETTDDALLTVEGMRLGFLAPGTLFNLRSWRVCGYPEGAPELRPPLVPTKEESHERLRGE